MFGSALLAVGCLLLVAAFIMFRRNAADRGRYRGAVPVTGEVVDVVPQGRRAARVRVRFRFQDASHQVVLGAWWNTEEGEWYLGGCEVGERVPLLVPPHRPEGAAPAVDVKCLTVVPLGVGLFGSVAIGFGLVLLTESVVAAIFLVGGMWAAGLGLFLYFVSFSRRNADQRAGTNPNRKPGPGG